MFDVYRKATANACSLILAPLVKILLQYGFSYQEFEIVSKQVFVDVASVGDRKANISNIAIRTGLSRKVIKSIIRSFQGSKNENSQDIGLHDIRLLSRWRNDGSYLDSSGNSIHLEFYASEGKSLSGLIAELGVDIPASTLVKHLMATDALEIDPEGRYFPKHSVSPLYSQVDPATIVRAGAFLSAHIDNIYRNLFRDDIDQVLERQSFTAQIPAKFVDKVFLDVNNIGARALEDSCKSLDLHEQVGVDTERMIGLGVYSIDLEMSGIIKQYFSQREKDAT